MLKSALKNYSLNFLARLHAPSLVQKAFFRNRLTIVMYHAVLESSLQVKDWCFLDQASFRLQLEYLKKHFEILPLSTAVEKCKNGRLSSPTAAITFDDGFQNNYDVAFPILKELDIPSAIFLTTGFVDSDDTPWFTRFNWAMAETKKSSLSWENHEFDLTGKGGKENASAVLQNFLKTLPHTSLLKEVDTLVSQLGCDPQRPVPAPSPFRILGSKEIKEMADSGLVEFGAHTHNHSILSLLSLREKREQIQRSVKAVSELTGKPCELFAYPNGRKQDYDEETMSLIRDSGIRFALTTMDGPNDSSTPELEFKRYGVGADLGLAGFQMKVHHLVSLLRR